jgi:hypothetical protein
MLLALAVIGGGAYWELFLSDQGGRGIVSEAALDAAVAAPPSIPTAFTGWLHYTTTDPMLKDVTRHDRLLGGGLGPNGPNQALLEMTASAQYGKSVMISFPPVPEACAANDCTISLSWDGAPPVPYGFGLPMIGPDGQAMLQSPEYERFIADVAKAHTLKIIASLGMPDDYMLVFPVAGFGPARSH